MYSSHIKSLLSGDNKLHFITIWVLNLDRMIEMSIFANWSDLINTFEKLRTWLKILDLLRDKFALNLICNCSNCYTYNFSLLGQVSVETTIGFIKEAPGISICGYNVYHKNRLIRVPYLCSGPYIFYIYSFLIVSILFYIFYAGTEYW